MIRLLFLFLLFPSLAYTQVNDRFVARGLLTAKGTLAAGVPVAYSGTNAYVSGSSEYYLENNVSVKGGIWVFLGTSGAEATFSKNSTLYTGFYYHLPTNNSLDPFIGFEPGVNWTQLKGANDFHESYSSAFNPSLALSSGLNFYASQWIHLFVETKYLFGLHTSDLAPVSMNEFRIAFGFGFNIWAIRK